MKAAGAAVRAPGAVAGLGARLRVLRLGRGLTLDVLAEAAGIDKGYLSRLERGLKAPSIATLLRLSEALGVPAAELFGERVAEHAVHVMRAPERPAVPGDALGHAFQMLSRAGAALEAFVIHPAAEFPPESAAAIHSGEELLFVLSGTIEMRFADRGFVLGAGDCAQFPGHLPHRMRRVGPEPASALVAVTRPGRERPGK
ncbi:helix-turn-helix domain-containing protein [Plastoroseomonas hellenica]|uniref:XRE family transcriptional regulator n=1 Tax=Plastoroseomonas hellenica TaxID=2687306 RepID=A0ABS5F2R9_9PROT|nr:XRE family transcriptional regulator [Plastoroseomonas hellenica]MBR0666420.1 XRE family transcriptional regulator [Plastoroseomonas hellenica]